MNVRGHTKGETSWIELDGLHVPEAMTASATGRDLPFDVELAAELERGRMVVRSLRTTRGEITTEALRHVPVGKILNVAVLSLVAPMNLVGTDLAAARAQGPTEATLKLVAKLYRLAYLGGQKPTQAVADAFDVPRSTAARWVQQARRAGFLGPTRERKAGQLRRGRRSSEAASDTKGNTAAVAPKAKKSSGARSI